LHDAGEEDAAVEALGAATDIAVRLGAKKLVELATLP
jgi:hypothetical protein